MATSAPSGTQNPKNTSGYKPVKASTSNAAFAAVPLGASSVTARNGVPVQDRLLPGGLVGLSIINGMTAGYGDNDGTTSNPVAQAGTYGGNPKWAPTRIGVMRTAQGVPGTRYSLYFIFNPNEIDVQYASTSGQLPANYRVAGTTPNLAQSQTVSWSLIFDRTYDLLYGDNKNGNGANSRGVLEDVAALYNLTGTYGDTGVPLTTPVQVAFAQESSGQLWGFTGFINSFTITYGIFRYNMIPSRAEVDISMTMQYVAAQVPAVTPKQAVADIKGLASTAVKDIKGGLSTLFGGSSKPPVAKSQPPGTKGKAGSGNTKGPPTTGGV